jgi:hypothetical protein
VAKAQKEAAETRALTLATAIRDPNTKKIDTRKATIFIDSLQDLPADSKLKVVKDMHDYSDQMDIDNTKAYDDWQNKQDGEAQKLLDSGKYTDLKEFVKNSDSGVLSKQTEQSKWKQAWSKVADDYLSGNQTPSDPIVSSKLLERINNLWRENETPAQVKADIRKAFDEGKITQKGNESETFTGLMKSVDIKWNDVQQTIISSAYKNASDTRFFMQPPPEADKTATLQFNQLVSKWLIKYDIALKGYVRANPDAKSKEIEIEAETLRRKYSDMAFEDINKNMASGESSGMFKQAFLSGVLPIYGAYTGIKKAIGVYQSAQPKTGDTKILNGVTYTYNGKDWEF